MARSTRSPRPPPAATAPAPAGAPPRVVAVVDIGATAIRMEIAEVRPDGETRTLQALARPVELGKDTFTGGAIRRATIEACVGILRQFRAALLEFGIADPASVRAVATSAVREARNRERFLDRVYMATGFPVECIDEVEVSRLTYLAVRDLLSRERVPRPWDVLVVEVGGGTTEVLLLQGGTVAGSESYRLGSRRLRETLETYRAPAKRMRAILEQSIDRAIGQMRRNLPAGLRVPTLVAMSGDARFAAGCLLPDWEARRLGRLRPADLRAFTERLLARRVDEVVARHRLPYPEAETVGPALLAYVRIARAFGVREVLVPKIHLRTALEMEAATHAMWSGDFCAQVEHAAAALARKFGADARHGGHVAWLAGRMFDALQSDHNLAPRHGFLLRIAALLHEAGLFVSNSSHHKHSLYLILNSDLFGLTREDVVLVALVARYHRRSPPLMAHPYYGTLDRDGRLAVQKLAALLRVACALDRGHAQRLREVAIAREPDRLRVTIAGVEDLSVERMALREKGQMFEDVYGIPVALEAGPVVREADPHA